MLRAIFNNISEEEKNLAIENIVNRATPRYDFFVMITLSVSMAAFGVILDSVVILIGSMLVAPLLYPLLSLGLGVVAGDMKLAGRSFYTVLKSTGLGVLASFLIGLLFSTGEEGLLVDAVLGGSSAFMYTIIAAIAGFAAAFAVTKPHLNETLPGVAISVALIPPLSMAGVGLALWDRSMASAGLLLFCVNVIGILFSSMLVFSLFRFAVKKKETRQAVKVEDEVLAEETRKDAAPLG